MIHRLVGCLSFKKWLVTLCLISLWCPLTLNFKVSHDQAVELQVRSNQCLAQDSSLLKPDIPKLDASVNQNPPPATKKVPLQGKIQKDDQLKSTNMFGGVGKFFGKGEKGKTSSGSPLRGNANSNSASAQESIGIIGVKFVLFNGRAPVVNRVFPMTPAYRCGVQPFDVIVAVDGVPTFGLTKEEVYDMIVGVPGTPVTISIKREGDYKVFEMVRMDLNDITDPFVRRDYMMSM